MVSGGEGTSHGAKADLDPVGPGGDAHSPSARPVDMHARLVLTAVNAMLGGPSTVCIDFRSAPGREGPIAMTRLTVAALVFALASPAIVAQAQQDIPIQQDLKRMDRLDQRLGREDTELKVDPNVTPDNPDGVVGFDGPPFNYGDPGVMGDGPLPPGSPADDDDWY